MSTDDVLLAALRKAPLFRSLADDERAQLAARFAVLDIAPGELLVRQGDDTRALFLIARGRVEVDTHTERDGHIAVTLLSGGDVFGEFSLLDDEPRSATARALDPVHAYRLAGDAWDAFFDTHAPAVCHVLRALNLELAGRLRRLTARGKVSGPIPDAVLDAAPRPVEDPEALWPLLREMSFFAGFDDAQGTALLSRLLSWDVPAAHVLFRERHGVGGPFLIVEGSVEVYVSRADENRRLTLLEPGRLFGELALVDGKPRSATCVAREASRLLELPAAVYEELTVPGQALGDRLQAAVARSMIRSLRRGNRQQVGR